MKKSGYRVLIVGCGDIGSRHLQAVASLPELREVEVVDPRPSGLRLGQERLAEIQDCQPSTTFRWLSSLEEASMGGDLCIIGTRADVRCQLVYQVVETLGYSSFLLEKLVAQSVREYEDLMEFSKAKRLSVWVNCKARAHPSHKRVKAHLEPDEPIMFTTIGGNHGLVNNGVHAADLFLFYDGTDRIESSGARIDPILHPSKRGNDVFDLSGTLHGHSAKGSQLIISYVGHHAGPAHFSIASGRYRAIIDDMIKLFYESTVETGWCWRQVPFEANLMISHMTRHFAVDILRSGQCELPTLEECFPAHRFILTELQPHFNGLLNQQSDRCPAT